MNKVILIAGDSKVEGFKQNKTNLFNPERYNAFRSILGEKNFGFMEAGDLKKEILTGEKAPVYLLNNDLKPYISPKKGISSNLIIASNFENGGVFPTKLEVGFFLNYLEDQKKNGIIGDFINSSESTLFEDKISVLDLQNQGFSVPESYLVKNRSELKNILASGNQFIIKPRYGYSGHGVKKINSNSIDLAKGINLESCILQEEVDVQSESRLIFFDNKFLGARMIYDRRRPWEDKKTANRKHLVEKYTPSTTQIKESADILKYSDTVLGCIDWAHDAKGNYKYLELNGVGVGLGFKGGPYDLNEIVVSMIKDKYIK